MKTYLSGRISGLEPIEYIENFRNAQNFVWKKYDLNTYDIINPLDVVPFLGNCKRTITIWNFSGEYKIKHWSEFYKENWINFMINDIRELVKCDTVAFQSNWIDSRGAKIEMFISLSLNKKIIML